METPDGLVKAEAQTYADSLAEMHHVLKVNLLFNGESCSSEMAEHGRRGVGISVGLACSLHAAYLSRLPSANEKNLSGRISSDFR